jgi:hypothetical protein
MLLINVANEVSPAMLGIPVEIKRIRMPYRTVAGKPIVMMVHKADR